MTILNYKACGCVKICIKQSTSRNKLLRVAIPPLECVALYLIKCLLKTYQRKISQNESIYSKRLPFFILTARLKWLNRLKSWIWAHLGPWVTKVLEKISLQNKLGGKINTISLGQHHSRLHSIIPISQRPQVTLQVVQGLFQNWQNLVLIFL